MKLALHFRTLFWGWIVALTVVLPSSQSAFGQLPGPNWQYHWGDDFAGNTLDSTKWSYNYPWGTNHNHDATMSPDNVTLGDGTLTLTAERMGPGGDFQSGAISSGYNRFTFNGGYVEASIKLPDTPGSWPAFWGLFDGWPPEADIMEYPIGTAAGGGYNQDQYHTAWHYSTGSGNAAGGGQVNPGGVGDLGGTYHNFGMQWIEDDWVGFYFNGQLVREFGNDAAIAQMERMYLILNYAVGGWPGRPDLNEWAIGHTDEMKVDFVRIWKQADAFSTDWNYSGNSEYVQWDDPANWTGNVPNLGGATINFDTRTGLAEQRIDWAGRRTATILNFAGNTRYRLGWPDDRLVLGYGNSGSLRATINVDANTTVNHEIFSHLEIAGGLTINNDSNQAFLLTGHISGDGGVFINGPGAVHFSGDNNTYAGTTIIDSGGQGPGIAVARGQNSFGSGVILIGQQGNGTTGRLELENNSLVSNQITLNGRNNNSAGIQNNSGSNTIAGSVGIHVGGGSYIIDAVGGTLDLSGAANGGLAVQSFAGGDRTLTLQGTAAGFVSGRIENGAANLNLVKDGVGTWTLQDTNSYTGMTTILAGELIVNGTHTGGGDYFIAEKWPVGRHGCDCSRPRFDNHNCRPTGARQQYWRTDSRLVGKPDNRVVCRCWRTLD